MKYLKFRSEIDNESAHHFIFIFLSLFLNGRYDHGHGPNSSKD